MLGSLTEHPWPTVRIWIDLSKYTRKEYKSIVSLWMAQRAIDTVIRIWKSVPSIDLYGEAVQTDPARFPRSYEGACVSVVCIGVTITLIVLDIIRLSTAAVGSEVNSTCHFTNRNQIKKLRTLLIAGRTWNYRIYPFSASKIERLLRGSQHERSDRRWQWQMGLSYSDDWGDEQYRIL